MRVPLNWLADYVDLPADTDPHALAAEFASIGLEEEDFFGPEITGPLVVGRVLELVKEEHSNGKTVNWCRVDVGPEHNEDADDPKDPQPGEERPSRGIICGAHNFVVGDLIVACLPGAVLPGDFQIAARKTYGHKSDGMICSAKELGLGEDHDGIIVLKNLGLSGEPGDDAIALLGLDQVTLDVNVTPDRGYQLSMRGIAREYAQMKGQSFTDIGSPSIAEVNAPTADGFPVVIEDSNPIDGNVGCDQFTAVQVTGLDTSAQTPFWMQRRLIAAGMRPISLIVDVTNYVMLELGQPLHAYDTSLLGEEIVVRRAQAGEKFTTLDDVERTLDAEDLLITDRGGQGSDSTGGKIIGLAGVMGGAAVEVNDKTTDVVIESAHFDPISIARTARRHKLSSEASRRFERGVDPLLGPVAARRCADLLVELAGGTLSPATTQVGEVPEPTVIELPVERVGSLVGVGYTTAEVTGLLEDIGASIDVIGKDKLAVTVPSWRTDITADVDLIEEVARTGGYDRIPSIQPAARAGQGMTEAQRTRRRISNLLAADGYTEVLSYPFTSAKRDDQLRLEAEDVRRKHIRLANPMSEDLPLMRTNLLSTLVELVARNFGRGAKDVALFEAGLVSTSAGLPTGPGPRHLPGYHPTDAELEEIYASVPAQPYHYAGIISGNVELPGVWGKGRKAEATDVIDTVRRIAGVNGIEVSVEADQIAPWHPGRAAKFLLADGQELGHAGELHPKVCENLGLPARTVAFEIDLDALLAQEDLRTWDGALSTYPVSRQDVALIVDESLPTQTLAATLREGAGEELELLETFDLYTGDQLPEGKKSLAFRLTFRAADRTLKADDASAMREAATQLAAERHGAEVRS
ncbi:MULTISPECIES: phenylalanine--tRNA ligase subunit beta [Brevibacterium]|uniref:Phenylalanine--tRNA ligase beta subunit n=1 Tax=Brevibacterium antiquum CNRZ 918 TaxID=1255637 RepID=A0A2H1JH20_9MICO|nr:MULTISPECIES: phenylalanine--tRNA ligase subunit beta [Brevibacterium]SMX86760.1 phenylalanyl-tRNA synthetase beta subunit [Brevibacterium antiquum CNRZ 918]HCG57016.1 phenylalanine--tRNA ligase subunit beta [Brevibacterium sp.]